MRKEAHGVNDAFAQRLRCVDEADSTKLYAKAVIGAAQLGPRVRVGKVRAAGGEPSIGVGVESCGLFASCWMLDGSESTGAAVSFVAVVTVASDVPPPFESVASAVSCPSARLERSVRGRRSPDRRSRRPEG